MCTQQVLRVMKFRGTFSDAWDLQCKGVCMKEGRGFRRGQRKNHISSLVCLWGHTSRVQECSILLALCSVTLIGVKGVI